MQDNDQIPSAICPKPRLPISGRGGVEFWHDTLHGARTTAYFDTIVQVFQGDNGSGSGSAHAATDSLLFYI
jgi:hypothetical protein